MKLKNVIKLATIIIIIIALIFTYFYFQKEEKRQQVIQKEENFIDYDEYIEQQNEPLDTRLTHDKEIMFIYVAEMNNMALNQLPLGNLVDDEVSFNEETKAIYFYNENLTPYEDAEMMVLSEVYNFDILLSQMVDNTRGDSSRLSFRNISFSDIDNELQPVNNDNRLFLQESLNIKRLENTDNIEISFMDEEFILRPSEYKDFFLEEGELKSRILIRNFGSWETINMKYQIQVSN